MIRGGGGGSHYLHVSVNFKTPFDNSATLILYSLFHCSILYHQPIHTS